MDQMHSQSHAPATPLSEFPQGTEILQEVQIAASALQVWEALTGGIFSWWSHSFSEKPYLIALEPRIGGRFYEQFDAEGNGALYGTVNFCQPGRQLSFSGVMGMQGPVINQCTFRLEEQDGGTRLRISQQILGMVGAEVVAGYDQGWAALLSQLRAYVEEGKCIR